MAEEGQKEPKTVLEALFEVTDKADSIEDILIIYVKKDGSHSSNDNDLTCADAVFLLESYKHYILRNIFPER